ncbi:MAG TPA: hypothetical protein VM076_23580, partial [Gemmatimonadaceae bacterium]|nr:hypothetical protein [Gemmatimonadaceae bacterium]
TTFSSSRLLGLAMAFTATVIAGCQSDSVVGTPRGQSVSVTPTGLAAAVTEPFWSELAPVNGVLIGTPAGAIITTANDVGKLEAALASDRSADFPSEVTARPSGGDPNFDGYDVVVDPARWLVDAGRFIEVVNPDGSTLVFGGDDGLFRTGATARIDVA